MWLWYPKHTCARNVKPNSSQNGIKFILQYILTALALQSVQIADERAFAKGKTNGIFFVNTRQKIPKASAFGIFSFVPAGHNIVWPKVNIILSKASTSFATSRKWCALQWCGFTPNDVALAQTDCLLAILVQGSGNEQLSCFMRIILKNTPQCDTMQSERRCNYVTSELWFLRYTFRINYVARQAWKRI